MNGTEWNKGKDKPQAGSVGQAGQEEQEFEVALTRALRRVAAPEDFAARVVALAEAEERTARVSRAARAPWWHFSIGWKPAWGGLAALLVAGVLTGHVVREHRVEEQAKEQARQEIKAQASRQFDTAVQITDRALDHAREQLRRKGVAVDGE